jgi:hypothetical protein
MMNFIFSYAEKCSADSTAGIPGSNGTAAVLPRKYWSH